MILGAFVASGALAGLAGFLFLSRFGTITVNAGNGLELQSVAAAVVGGVNIFGGSGTLIGALLGALLINLLDLSLLRVPGLSEFWRDAVLGAADPDRRRRRLPARQAHRPDHLTRERRGRAAGGARCVTRPLKWRWELFLAVVLVVVFFVNVSISEFYLGEQNFVNMFQLSIEKLIVVVIMTFVIINGEIDLSVASVMALQRLRARGAARGGLGPVRAGGRHRAARRRRRAGALQGAFVAFMGLPSLVVTLAGLIGWRGAGRILVEDRSIGDFPEWFETLGQEPVIGRVSFAVDLLRRSS